MDKVMLVFFVLVAAPAFAAVVLILVNATFQRWRV